jgi:hypothetical protein
MRIEQHYDKHLAVEAAEFFTERLIDLPGVADPAHRPVALPALPDDSKLNMVLSPFVGRTCVTQKQRAYRSVPWRPSE